MHRGSLAQVEERGQAVKRARFPHSTFGRLPIRADSPAAHLRSHHPDRERHHGAFTRNLKSTMRASGAT